MHKDLYISDIKAKFKNPTKYIFDIIKLSKNIIFNNKYKK